MPYFVGIDPGKNGSIVVLRDTGRIVSVADLPAATTPATGYYDPPCLLKAIRSLCRLPDARVWLEWPNTRPGEGAQRSRNFGLGLGYLEMALLSVGAQWTRLDPRKWTGRLGCPGKEHTGWLAARRKVFRLWFPAQEEWILGPRGGVLDGRLDAALIAEYGRQSSAAGLRSTVARFGKDSDQALCLAMGRRKGRRT